MTGDLSCAVSTCTRRALRGYRYCLPHGRALSIQIGRMKDDAKRREILANTASLHVTDAHEVAEAEAGQSKPPRYKLTQRGDLIQECQGGLPSLGKAQ